MLKIRDDIQELIDNEELNIENDEQYFHCLGIAINRIFAIERKVSSYDYKHKSRCRFTSLIAHARTYQDLNKFFHQLMGAFNVVVLRGKSRRLDRLLALCFGYAGENEFDKRKEVIDRKYGSILLSHIYDVGN